MLAKIRYSTYQLPRLFSAFIPPGGLYKRPHCVAPSPILEHSLSALVSRFLSSSTPLLELPSFMQELEGVMSQYSYFEGGRKGSFKRINKNTRNELEIKNELSHYDIMKILDFVEMALRNNGTTKETVDSLVSFCNVSAKYSKVTRFNNNRLYEVIKIVDDGKALDNILLTKKIEFIRFSASIGYFSDYFLDIFKKDTLKIIQNKKMLQWVVTKIFKTFQSYGEIDQIYWDQIRSHTLDCIRQTSNQNIIVLLSQTIAITDLKDKEAVELLARNLSELDFERLFIIQKRILHTSLKYLIESNTITSHMIRSFQLNLILNQLTSFCIMEEQGKSLSNMYSPPIDRLLNCCSKDDKTKVFETMGTNYSVNKQKYSDNPTELMIKECLKQYVESIPGLEFTSESISICQYSLDCMIKTPEHNIYVEISGQNYISSNNTPLGKKQLKFKILELQSLDICTLMTSDSRVSEVLKNADMPALEQGSRLFSILASQSKHLAFVDSSPKQANN